MKQKLVTILIFFGFVSCLFTSVLLISSCGQADRMEAQLTGYSSRCINGVLYYQFASGVTVAYNQDGTIKKCK